MDGEMSWGKAGLHVLVACGALTAVGIVFAFLGAFQNPGAAGEEVGKVVLWVVLATLAASWAFQTGKGALGILLAGIVVALLGVEAFGLVRLAHHPAGKAGGDQDLALEPLTPTEKVRPQTIVADHEARLCHVTLEFSIPQPTGFTPAEALEATLRNAASGASEGATKDKLGQWAFESPETHERVILMAAKGLGRTEAGFRDFTAGLKSGIGQGAKITIEDDDTKWTNGRGDFTLGGTANGKVHVDLRCLSRELPPLVVCVETVALTSASLSRQRNGLRLLPCDS
jgi:hypothetical protein